MTISIQFNYLQALVFLFFRIIVVYKEKCFNSEFLLEFGNFGLPHYEIIVLTSQQSLSGSSPFISTQTTKINVLRTL